MRILSSLLLMFTVLGPVHVLPSARAASTGLDFPSNDVATSVRFRFPNPQNNGLPQYGPNGSGVTYIWKIHPRHQNGYYTTFFWGPDGPFTGASYYGAHPYPDGGGSNTPTHKWEISINGSDIVTDKNGNSTSLGYNQWYTQVLRVWKDGNGQKRHEFYWNLPDTSKVITYTADASYGEALPANPALTFGDAPWSQSNEMLNGILRGLQIYNINLTPQDILSEVVTPLSTTAGNANIWYLNLNPTPTDIADKSGRGHHPEWVGSARPSLYTDNTTPPAPTLTLSTSPASITSGSSADITWSSTNTTSCVASNGWNGVKSTSGTESVAPTTTTTYTLACTGPNGSETKNATVTVNPVTNPPAVNIGASPTSIAPNSSSLLTWSSTNSTSCAASDGWNGAKPASGAQSVTPSVNTTYTLTCTGAAGGTTRSATVILSAPASAPTDVLAIAGAGAINVKFGAPANNGGSSITGYIATCTSSNGGILSSNAGGAGATSILVAGLTYGKNYTCSVTASNAAGTGTASAPSNVVTPFDISSVLNLLLED